MSKDVTLEFELCWLHHFIIASEQLLIPALIFFNERWQADRNVRRAGRNA